MQPLMIETTLHRLHTINAEHQPIPFLQQARNHGTHLEVLQDAHRLEWYRWHHASALLLWIAEEPIPLDNVHPQWDTVEPLKSLLLDAPIFPHAVLWSPTLTTPLESPWPATHWWPQAGITDAVDNPSAWLAWWWSAIMNEQSSAPSFQTSNNPVTLTPCPKP